LLDRKAQLEEKTNAKDKIVPIPPQFMATYITPMQGRLKDKEAGYKREGVQWQLPR